MAVAIQTIALQNRQIAERERYRDLTSTMAISWFPSSRRLIRKHTSPFSKHTIGTGAFS